jgi:hypothetical protein
MVRRLMMIKMKIFRVFSEGGGGDEEEEEEVNE